MTPPTLTDAIKEIEREIALRRRCYPKWIRERGMSPDDCDFKIACMQLALDNLKDLAALA